MEILILKKKCVVHLKFKFNWVSGIFICQPYSELLNLLCIGGRHLHRETTLKPD